MTDYMKQNTEHVQLPSARERIAALRKDTESVLQKNIKNYDEPGATSMVCACLDRLWHLDVADILLDAMRDGPDVGRVVEQMKKPDEQEALNPLAPGLFPSLPKFTVGQKVRVISVPPSHEHLCLVGREGFILEIEKTQDWMKEPWYRLRCGHDLGGPGYSEGSLPQSSLVLISKGKS